MKSINRREFLISGGMAVGLALPAWSTEFLSKTSPRPTGYQNPIAVASYSFWRFKDEFKLPMERCIELAAEMGFAGLDVLHIQMHREDDQYLRELKRHALVNGVTLCGLSIHQSFVTPDKTKRQEHIKHTIKMIEMA